jgi:hypothetical protein
MEFEAVKAAIMKLDQGAQRRMVLEVLPAIWSNLVEDEACLQLIRQLIDGATVKKYQEEHLDHI